MSDSEILRDDWIKCHPLKYFTVCPQSHNNCQGTDKLTQTYMEEKTVNCRWGKPSDHFRISSIKSAFLALGF